MRVGEGDLPPTLALFSSNYFENTHATYICLAVLYIILTESMHAGVVGNNVYCIQLLWKLGIVVVEIFIYTSAHLL